MGQDSQEGMGIAMVDKVSNQKYYEYSKINQQKRGNTESSEFNLDLGKQGVIYEKSSQKKAEKTKGAAAQKDAQKSASQAGTGVKVEISRQGYRKTAAKRQEASLAEGVRKYVAAAVDFLKSLWNKIWNDNTASSKEQFPEILEEKLAGQDGAEGRLPGMDGLEGNQGIKNASAFFGGIDAQEESRSPAPAAKPGAAEPVSYTQEEIRRIFRRGNRQEIEDFLSNHGERRLAKNTELLTQYDRRGSIVGIDHAQKELILFGSKNEIRL